MNEQITFLGIHFWKLFELLLYYQKRTEMHTHKYQSYATIGHKVRDQVQYHSSVTIGTLNWLRPPVNFLISETIR